MVDISCSLHEMSLTFLAYCMKCQILFSGKKENILSFAEFAH